ncbi:MAG: hypothetical protein OEW81_05500 [Gammaproteobacteria bacterium]|nr:hypothetical protein [Gammaproteobacteria bacterium]
MQLTEIARKRWSKLAIFVAAVLPPGIVWAVCNCGFGDGQFTLVSINTDGNMADWLPVHADLDNNVCDGPANGLVDRDAPVQSTGRDLAHFAFTFDNSNVYLFTERAGSTSNVQSFAYYADTDNDGLMETNEPVIGVTWSGNNRQVNVYVFTYVAQAPAGDPMIDNNGFGDGYTLPGSFANVPATGNPTRSGAWGSTSGQQMEFYVTWSELGLAPNTPFSFHIASSNASLGANSFTAQIDDNLGGCGGGPGTMVQSGVTFTPDRSLTGLIGQTVVGVHTLTNDGNANDSYDFSATQSGDFSPSVSYYQDTDGSGTLTAADTLLTDTDGDALPNTAPIAPGASITVLVAYGVPATAAAGESATVVSTAASDFQPLANDAVTDTIAALPGPRLVVSKNVTTLSDPVNLTTNPRAIPGSVVAYAIMVANEGAGTVDADAAVIVDSIPNDGCMIVTDIAGAGSGPVSFVDGSPGSNLNYSFISLGSLLDDIAFSNDGGLSYSYTPTPDASGCDPSVTHVEINPTGEFAANAGAGSPSVTFIFRVLMQ